MALSESGLDPMNLEWLEEEKKETLCIYFTSDFYQDGFQDILLFIIERNTIQSLQDNSFL